MDGLPIAYQRDSCSPVDGTGFEAPGLKNCVAGWIALRSRGRWAVKFHNSLCY